MIVRSHLGVWVRRALLLLVASGIATGAVWAQSPWQLPAADAPAIERRYASSYWYENYTAAIDPLQRGRRLDQQELQEVIDRLRYVIKGQPRSDPDKINRTTRESIAYFPYLYLAQAFTLAQDYESARLTLDKVDPELIQSARGKEYGTLYASLDSEITAQRSVQLYFAAFESLDKLKQGVGGVWVTQAGRAQLDQLLANKPSRTGSITAARVESEFKPMLRSVIQLMDQEMTARRERITGFGGEAWSSIVPAAQLRELSGYCQAIPESTRVDDVPTIWARFERCLAGTDQVYAAAGAKACEALRALDATLEQKSALLKRQGGSAVAGPELPSGCSTNWQSVPRKDVWAAFDAIAYPSVAREFVATTEGVQQEIASVLEAKNQALAAVLKRVPSVSNSCVSTLRLGPNQRELDGLRSRIEDGMSGEGAAVDAAVIGPEVERVRDAMLKRAVSQIDDLLSEKDACEGVDETPFQPLPAVRQSLASSGSIDDLESACRSAAAARKAVDTCWSRNSGAVLARAQGLSWMLERAQQIQKRFDEQMECVPTALEGLKQVLGQRSQGQGWIDRALEANLQGESCIDLYQAERGRWLKDTVARLDRGSEVLEELGGQDWGSLTPTVQRIEREYRTNKDALAEKRSLLKLDLEQDAEPIRAALERIRNPVDSQRWEQITALRNADRARGLFALVDIALSVDVKAAEQAVVRAAPVLDRLGAVKRLNGALAMLDRGELGSMAQSLRSDLAAGTYPAQGRATAVARALLGYSLYLHWVTARATQEGSFATQSALADTVAQVQGACVADPSFKPQEGLFAHTEFRELYRDNCSGP